MSTATMGPAALRASRCTACSLSALRLLIGNLAETRISVTTSKTKRFAPSAASARYSTFRATPRLLSGPAIEEREAERRDNGRSAASSESDSSDVPWYLQVEPPRHPTLLHEPQPLPDIPEGSPKLMEPLLKFVSDELGLDDLSLLDLREMDPPPALGPDLLMLFGTARSERHLHVSADRLVRWLRGRGVAATADGLLGRNELKIKLRRIARKAKLLGSSGVARGGDDGISTGWICVNLGQVEGSHQEMKLVDEEGRPTGFGVPRTGTTVVIQMLTESKRQDLDLETFWRDTLKESLEKRGLLTAANTPEATGFGSATPRAQSVPGGRRFFSTSPRLSNAATASECALADVVSGGSNVQEAMARAKHVLEHDVESKLRLLGRLKAYFNGLPRQEADMILAKAQNMETSGFLRLYDRAVQGLPPRQAWEHRLWLWATARSRGLSGYDVAVAKKWLREIQTSGAPLTRETC
ncbi:hypothetical protein VTK56DRAFT_8421 [Thermocarpiscus australiensis]